MSSRTLWERLKTPGICERLIAFSPVVGNKEMLVVSYEGMHLVNLRTGAVETNPRLREYAAYDSDAGVATFRNREFPMVGLHGGPARLASAAGEVLSLDAATMTVSVRKGGVLVFSAGYTNFSGDWAQATFSADDRFITVGSPYDFDLFVWERYSG